MAESAEVLSLEVLSELRVALIRFSEDATIALQDVDFDIRRTLEWLSNEQRLYWQSEIKRWQQKLSQARTELERKRLGRFLDRKPDTSQEEKAVKRAQERLENAQHKLEVVRRWVPEFRQAMQEYHSQVQGLSDLLELQLPRDLARLARMIEALEQYVSLAAPTTSPVLPAGSAPADQGDESMARPVGDESTPSAPDPGAPPATAPESEAAEPPDSTTPGGTHHG